MALAPAPIRLHRPGLDLDVLERALRGRVLRPGDPEYETRRAIRQLAVDRRPLAIVQPADAHDVAVVVDVARETGLDLAVRGGGHSFAGFSTVDDGIVLDMTSLKGLHIDPESKLAWAQAGLTAREYTTAAAAHGLATPFGDTASVGIAGLTLGGGIGFLARKHGLAIDALVSVEVVTADGRIVTASEEENADLFWAVRGGGGNFGIVTRFQFRLYEVDTVLGGMIFLPPSRDVIRGLIDAARNAPEELTTITFMMPAPPAPFIPEAEQGKVSLGVIFVWAGDPAAGQEALAPIRALAEPIADIAMPMPYPEIYAFTAEAEPPAHEILRSIFAHDLDDEMIDVILDRMENPPSEMFMTQLRVLGGAMGRVPSEATAFAHRAPDVMVTIAGLVGESDPTAVERWVVDYFAALHPKADGAYSNFLAIEGEERIREAYPNGAYERLVAVKRRWDPGNLFRLNQNIRPD